jgi:hypothetical protein
MKEYILKGNSDKPMDEEIIPFGVEDKPSPPPPVQSEKVKEVVRFFAGEGTDDFIEKEALADLVAYAASMKQSFDEIERKYEAAKNEIKKRLEGEMTGKKLIKDFGDNQVILSKRSGSVKFDAEGYIKEQMGDKTWAEIEQTKEEVKAGKMESRYFTQGKDSVSIEVI